MGVENILQCCALTYGEVIPGSLPHLTLGLWRVSGAFSDELSHHTAGVFFTLVQLRLSDVKKIP